MQEYNANSLTILTGLDNIRQSPAEYVGSVAAVSAEHGAGHEEADEILTAGGFHLFVETLANATDEANNVVNGKHSADHIDIYLNDDQSITVKDNGRGLPIDMNDALGLPGAVIIFLRQNAGAKMLDKSGSKVKKQRMYKSSAGLHGMGSKCVSALSDRVDVQVFKGAKCYEMQIKRGKPGKFKDDTLESKFTPCEASEALRQIKDPRSDEEKEIFHTGTSVHWHPDPVIWGGTDIPKYDIYHHTQSMSYMTPGCHFRIIDNTGKKPKITEFYHPGGINDMIDEKTAKGTNLSPVIAFDVPSSYTKSVTTENEDGTMSKEDVTYDCEIKCALRWTSRNGADIEGYANGVHCTGKHVDGFRRGITRGVNDWIKNSNLMTKKDEKDNISPNIDDITDGMVAVIEVLLEDQCDFQGQTKDVLGNAEVLSCVSDIMKDQINRWLSARKNAASAKKIGKSILDDARLRSKQKKERDAAKQVKEKLGTLSSKPAKLLDCRNEGPGTELLICEGDSASGTIKMTRDASWQALLPVRGVTLKVYGKSNKKILDNAEFADVVSAMRAGGIRDDFDIEHRRYERIGIYTDADEDGNYIRSLLLLFIYTCFPGMIEGGYVFAGCPPLYSIEFKNGKNKGKKQYAIDEAERDSIINKFIKNGGNLSDLSIQRSKGLGESDAAEFKECLSPDTRKVRVITLSDVDGAREKAEAVFKLLFSEDEKTKQIRRKWINASFETEED